MPSLDHHGAPPIEAHSPTLSLILCSRNDNYMGNARWRLQTALNYVARSVQTLGRTADVEILVTDWGSEIPLHEVLDLSPEAAGMTSFVVVPPATAKTLQRDSPFAEVIALNAAARRATGTYIGRIDQDTLVGARFLKMFFEKFGKTAERDMPLAMGFSNVKMINYRFAVRCPSFASVEAYVRLFGRSLKRENWHSRSPFYHAAVGIWLLHRTLWEECGGYDERMIYMNSMETNMTRRLLPKYAMTNLGELCDYDFYHLEHYHPWVPRLSRVYRKVNSHQEFATPDALNPNGDGWGLRDAQVEVRRARAGHGPVDARSAGVAVLSFAVMMLRIFPATAFDHVGLSARRQVQRLRHAWQLIQGHPVGAWPRVLVTRWKERRS